MRGAVLHGPGDVRCEECPEPRIVEPTDAIVRLGVTCICGSDLWPYRGLSPAPGPMPMGHEYCGLVEDVGRDVKSIRPGQFVIGSFAASDNTCAHCRAGYQTSCAHREWVTGAQAPLLRVPLADGTLVATPEVPSADLVPSLLAVSDVLGTGWFAADAAAVKPGATVVVVGDGAVGLRGWTRRTSARSLPRKQCRVRGADGGITLYIQHESPGKSRESNWLPAPQGPFFMVLREYWPKPEALNGSWKLPQAVRAAKGPSDGRSP